jgi:hypothetical protein
MPERSKLSLAIKNAQEHTACLVRMQPRSILRADRCYCRSEGGWRRGHT